MLKEGDRIEEAGRTNNPLAIVRDKLISIRGLELSSEPTESTFAGLVAFHPPYDPQAEFTVSSDPFTIQSGESLIEKAVVSADNPEGFAGYGFSVSEGRVKLDIYEHPTRRRRGVDYYSITNSYFLKTHSDSDTDARVVVIYNPSEREVVSYIHARPSAYRNRILLANVGASQGLSPVFLDVLKNIREKEKKPEIS